MPVHITELYKIYQQFPSVQTDTRKLKQGDLYFALSGANFDGNAFAAEALQKGAAYAIIDNATYAVNAQCIVVPDVLTTLQELARHHRLQFNIPFIAITGSNGKTTTKELIAAVLRTGYNTSATEGNLNNHIGVPLTLLKIQPGTQMAIIEMGANHQREIAGYCQIALPTHGLITNCGKAHIEGFGGIEGVRKGKGELYDFLRAEQGVIFRNTDLDYLKEMAHDIAVQVTYGTTGATYTGHPVMDNVFLQVVLDMPGGQLPLHTNLVGEYNFPNVLAAAAIGLHFGLTPNDIKAAIAAYSPDNSRSQWLKKGSNQVILDAYNANPTSMRAAIMNFAAADLPGKMLWLGGMKEMGHEEHNEHEALVALVDEHEWQQVILVGKEFSGLSKGYLWFDTSAEAAAYIKEHQPQNSAILIKGSRGSKMEVMAGALPE